MNLDVIYNGFGFMFCVLAFCCLPLGCWLVDECKEGREVRMIAASAGLAILLVSLAIPLFALAA